MSPTPNGNANANATAKNKGSKEGTISVPGRITTRGGPLPEAAASSIATEGPVFASAVADAVEATPVGRSRLTTLRKAEALAAALSSQRMLERSSTIALGRGAPSRRGGGRRPSSRVGILYERLRAREAHAFKVENRVDLERDRLTDLLGASA